MRFCWRTARTPKRAGMSIKPMPRISMWCAASSWPRPISTSLPRRVTCTTSSATRRWPRSKRLLDDRLDPAIEFRGFELAAKDGNTFDPGKLQQLRGDLLTLGDENTGQVEAEKIGQRITALLGGEGVEIGDL